MKNNIKDKILEIFVEKQKYDEKYHNLILNFLNKAYELVDLSKDMYQIEHTIKLNEISLKDYILNSEMCKSLKFNHISNYSIYDLKEFMKVYEKQNKSDIGSYKLALELFEKLEEIKKIERSKIDYEVNNLSNILEDIKIILSINKDKYQDLYYSILKQIKLKYLDCGLIDDKINNYILQILNDIFNFYINGYSDIPIEN